MNGTCDFTFSLYDDPSAGALLGTRSVPNVTLVDGLFTARLDFGVAAHTGGARWLAISVRCPAGSDTYVPLTPWQELTAAPAALALALPFAAIGTYTGPLVSISNSGTSGSSGALSLSSAGGDGLVGSTGSGADGIHVQSAGDDGVEVVSAGGPDVGGVDRPGRFVRGLDGRGWCVRGGSAAGDGMLVTTVGRDGYRVNSAGGNGVYVGSVKEPWREGGVVEPRRHPCRVGGMGRCVARLGEQPRHLGRKGALQRRGGELGGCGSAGGTAQKGVLVATAGGKGVHVYKVGTPPGTIAGNGKIGFEVEGAEGDGMWVGRTGWAGVSIGVTGGHGYSVYNAGDDGLHVESAGGDGVDVWAAGDLAGYFGGNIYVAGNCIGCLVAVFGLNASDSALVPGDVVTIQGMAASTLDDAPQRWKVVPAGGGGAVVGVVSGRAEVDVAGEGEKLLQGETGQAARCRVIASA